MEVWKTIKGFENYEASNYGEIKRNGKLLKQGFCKKGYPRVYLSIDGKKKTIRTHILIANAFLNYVSNGNQQYTVDHIDNNKSNNNTSNLQVITNRENTSKDKKSKTSKYTGVYWDKSRSKWHSEIRIGKVKKHLGRFDSEIDAKNKYLEALNEYNNGN